MYATNGVQTRITEETSASFCSTMEQRISQVACACRDTVAHSPAAAAVVAASGAVVAAAAAVAASAAASLVPVACVYLTNARCAVRKGDRVAQLILERISTPAVVEVADLPPSVRCV